MSDNQPSRITRVLVGTAAIVIILAGLKAAASLVVPFLRAGP